MKRNIIKKAMVILAIAIAFVAGCQLGYHTTAGKDYEAACLFSDIIRCAMDSNDPLGSEMQELYGEWTQDIDLGVYNFKYLKEEDLDSYVWCY